MNNKTNRPELLCPAGSAAAFSAAIEGGADAVYVGGTSFNARINAKNFTKDELSEAIKLAHAYGVRVYVAANTLIYDNEARDFLHAAEDAYLSGADALIVADLGMADAIRRRIPIELHGSTQLSGHNTAAARLLSAHGFSRMVCAREMSRDDLLEFTKNSPIESEVFVHGALCVCVSGQCLFSSLVGGRSGNRGECAQPCRLPFKSSLGSEYPLSLKDLSLAAHIPELADMGVNSFKIEGRMKSPEYVRDVARIWRRLIDEGRGATSAELCALAEIFSRGGFTDAYYTRKISSEMLGIRSNSDKQSSRALTPFVGITKKLPISLSATLTAGKPSKLTLSDGKHTVTVTGDTPEVAHTTPISEAAVEKNLLKLGSTPYFAEHAEISLSGDIMLPLSAINALRRRGTEALIEASTPKRSEADLKALRELSTTKKGTKNGNSAYFHFPERIPKEAYSFFESIFVPLEKYDGSTNGAALPPVVYDSEKEGVRQLLTRAAELGCRHILVGNIGHLELVSDLKATIHGDFRLNVTNTYTAILLEKHFEDIILSPELTLPKLRDIKSVSPYARPQIYGRTPLMITEKCIAQELSQTKEKNLNRKERAAAHCKRCTEGTATLTDRRGVSFPVLRGYLHRSIIVNSLPTYMADRQRELKNAGIIGGHFIFTVESEAEIRRIILAYQNGTPPSGEVRRIK